MLREYSAPRNKFGDRPPPTQHKGSRAIDDIYISRQIQVQRTGHYAFGDGPGDHRGLFLDVNESLLFGASLQVIHRLPARLLNSPNVKVVTKFNKLFEYQLERKHVGPRVQQLYERMTYPVNPDETKLYEKLDRIQVQAFNFANKRCRKLRMGEVPFAPEVVQIEGRRIAL